MLNTATAGFADMPHEVPVDRAFHEKGAQEVSFWSIANQECSMSTFTVILAALAAVGLTAGLSIFLLTTN